MFAKTVLITLLLSSSVLADARSESRVRVALALAQAGAAHYSPPTPTLTPAKIEEPPKQPQWEWRAYGDYAYLYLDGKHYATWSYSRGRYLYAQPQAAVGTSDCRH